MVKKYEVGKADVKRVRSSEERKKYVVCFCNEFREEKDGPKKVGLGSVIKQL